MLISELIGRPISFPVKASFFDIPLIGFVLRQAGCIPVNRENTAQAIQAMNQVAKEAIELGRSVCVSAEGSRRRKRSEFGKCNVNLPLKKGAFHILKKLKYDLLVVKIIGGSRLMPTGQYYLNQGSFTVSPL